MKNRQGPTNSKERYEKSRQERREKSRQERRELNAYILISIGMRKISVTPREILEPIPSEFQNVVYEHIFSNPWYEARTSEMIMNYVDRNLRMLEGFELVQEDACDTRRITLTERGERKLENILENYESGNEEYGLIPELLQNIVTS